MRNPADRRVPPGYANIGRVAPFALTVGAVVLAWQVAIQPVLQRAPIDLAIRIAPASPLVLRRAAEAELAAERNDNAAALSREALGRSPFDVRALRVVGLTEARVGRLEEADQILTLAGNWSLRDDPTHAWLVDRRLRRGDYASAFAHADTLVRRREDLQPQVFRLFTAAATEDPQRVLPVLASLLASSPPWRRAYFESLYKSDQGLQVAATTGIMLQSSDAPLTTVELQELYSQMLARGQIAALNAVRIRLNRPASNLTLTNGGFDDPSAPAPFQWTLLQRAGAAAEIVPDDINPSNPALRIEYDGFVAATFARQKLFLRPGRYQLRAVSRSEAGEPAGRISWRLACDPGDEPVLTASAVTAVGSETREWTPWAADFSVPRQCSSQWLELRGHALDRRTPMVVWFDRISITSLD